MAPVKLDSQTMMSQRLLQLSRLMLTRLRQLPRQKRRAQVMWELMVTCMMHHSMPSIMKATRHTLLIHSHLTIPGNGGSVCIWHWFWVQGCPRCQKDWLFNLVTKAILLQKNHLSRFQSACWCVTRSTPARLVVYLERNLQRPRALLQPLQTDLKE